MPFTRDKQNLAKTLLVGVGSPHGDDQLGWEVAKRMQRTQHNDMTVRLARTPTDLLDWLACVERLVVCDACRGAGKVGGVHRWTWPTNQLETLRWSGTHDVSLPAVLALAEQLERLPECVTIWAVEVGSSCPGATISPKARSVIAAAVHDICNDLEIIR